MAEIDKLRRICSRATPGPWSGVNVDGDMTVDNDDDWEIACGAKDYTFIETFNPHLASKLLDLWEVVEASSPSGDVREALMALERS